MPSRAARTAAVLALPLLAACAATTSSSAPRAEPTPITASSASGGTLAPAPGPTAPLPPPEQGFATWYSDSLAGHHTASGEPYDPHKLTAAHRTLPLGTRVRVRRDDTGRVVEVTVNDRGPFGSARRIIDLSRAAATELEMLSAGVVRVTVEVLELGAGRRRHHHHHTD